MAYSFTTLSKGPEPDGSGMVFEDVKVTGSGDTTGTYTAQFVKQPQFVRGPFTYSISGTAVTLGSASLSGSEVAQIVGYA